MQRFDDDQFTLLWVPAGGRQTKQMQWAALGHHIRQKRNIGSDWRPLAMAEEISGEATVGSFCCHWY